MVSGYNADIYNSVVLSLTSFVLYFRMVTGTITKYYNESIWLSYKSSKVCSLWIKPAFVPKSNALERVNASRLFSKFLSSAYQWNMHVYNKDPLRVILIDLIDIKSEIEENHTLWSGVC